MRIPIGLVLTLLFLVCGGGFSQDTDQDGIPDEAEAVLGSDPKTAERFVTIWERPAGKEAADAGRTFKRVSVANAGGNRFIWRVEFLAPYPPQNSVLQLYLDADNAPATGRQPQHGCEYMLRQFRGDPGVSAFEADGKTRTAVAPRVAFSGENVFYSYDVDLAQRQGESVFRLSVLSETSDPHKAVSSTGYFTAKGPPMSDRPKIRLDSDVTESVGVEQTWGLDRINALVEDPKNVSIWIKDCKLDGFRFDKSEYRADNALRAASGGAITATVPQGATGKFFVGFIMRDEAGREAVAIDVRGERLGVAVANYNDNNQHLFFLTEAVELKPGDEIRLRALNAEGNYRTEDLVLLREKPAARPLLHEFREIAATENRLTWITTWAAQCTVEYSRAAQPEAAAQKIVEPMAVDNHRVLLPDVKPGETVRYRITATTRDGREANTDWREFTWKLFVEPATRQSGRVKLRVEPPAATEGKLRDWPVTSGVPFPQGALGGARNVRLLDERGDVVPLQAAVTGRWADGSVKWLLLDFRHSGGAGAYTLEFGPDVTNQEPEQKYSPPAEFGGLALTDAAGREHEAVVGGLAHEEGGGLRRCLRGEGKIGEAPFAYEARIHVYPGLPWARALITFGHDTSPDEFTTVRSLAWRLPNLRGEPRFVRQHRDDQYESSDGGGKRFSGPVGPVFVRDFWQNYPKDLDVGPDGATLWLMPPLKPNEADWAKGTPDEHKLFYWFDAASAGGQAGGYKLRQGMTKTHEVWLGLDGRTPPLDRPLFAAAEPQWYVNSNAFGEMCVADSNRVIVGDYDRKVTGTLDDYLGNREKVREFGMFNFGDWWGERLINWGNSEYDTQHAFFLQFARSGDLRFLQAGEEAEVHNRDVDTVHYHTNAGRIGCVYAHCIGHVGDYYAKSPLPGRNQGTASGGFSVSHTWCEGHMDHYFLTGDRRSYETGLKIADHYDTYRMINYEFSNCRDSGWQLILTLGVYRATGDPFYLNASKIIVERVLERQTPKPKFNTKGGGWRRMMVPGHCLCEPAHYGNAGFMVGVLLTGLKWHHMATGDPRVAKSLIMASHFLIDDMWAEDVRGFRYTSCPKSSKGPWSNFLLFDGIGYAYRLTQEAGQPDKKLARYLIKGAEPAIKAMSGMGKSFSMYIRVTPHVIGLLAELHEKPPVPIADAGGDKTIIPFAGTAEIAFDASASRTPDGQEAACHWDFGDGRTAQGKVVKHAYEKSGRYQASLTVRTADGQADTAAFAVTMPPLWLLKADKAGIVLVEAEAFSAQGGGKVESAERVACSGAMITKWATPGQWVEWKFTAPEDGRYLIGLKYCTGDEDARRAIELDGATLGETAFPKTGGWSAAADNWAHTTLGGEDAPTPIDLKDGSHTLRMTCLSGGLGLDYIVLKRE